MTLAHTGAYGERIMPRMGLIVPSTAGIKAWNSAQKRPCPPHGTWAGKGMKNKDQQVPLPGSRLETEAIQQVIDLILTGDYPRCIGSHLGAIEQGTRLGIPGTGCCLLIQRRG